MNVIYFVVAIILSGLAWISKQLVWQYANILFYIFLFFASWYINMFLFHQEEFEKHKKYNIFTPIHIIYPLIIIGLIWYFKDYRLKDYNTIKYSFYKLVIIVNASQAVLLNVYYKFVDIYQHL